MTELRSRFQLNKSFARDFEASLDAGFKKRESSTKSISRRLLSANPSPPEARTPAPTLRFEFARRELDGTQQSHGQGSQIDASDTSITPRTGISNSLIWNHALVQSELVMNSLQDRDTSRLLVKERFDEIFEDPLAKLMQLKETDGIEDYHRKFELLRNQYGVNFSENCLVKAFLTGLRVDTEFNIRLFQPQTISQCLMVGRLYESAHPEDPFAKLNRLKETDSITEYHEQFQLISTSVKLPESALVRAFLYGLNEDTRLYINRLHPQTVRQCFVVGRLYERAHPKKTPIPQLVHTEHIKEHVKAMEFIQVADDLLGITDNSEFTRAEMMNKEETSQDEVVVGDAITRERHTQQHKVSENSFFSVMTVESDSLLAKKTDVEVEPEQELKEPKWRSKETYIPSLFQAEKDLAWDNIETAEELATEMSIVDQFTLQEMLVEELQSLKEINENVHLRTEIVVVKSCSVFTAEKTLLLPNLLQPNEKSVAREFFFDWLLQLHSYVSFDTRLLRTSLQAIILWDPGGFCFPEARMPFAQKPIRHAAFIQTTTLFQLLYALETKTLASHTGENAELVRVDGFQMLFERREKSRLRGIVYGSNSRRVWDPGGMFTAYDMSGK